MVRRTFAGGALARGLRAGGMGPGTTGAPRPWLLFYGQAPHGPHAWQVMRRGTAGPVLTFADSASPFEDAHREVLRRAVEDEVDAVLVSIHVDDLGWLSTAEEVLDGAGRGPASDRGPGRTRCDG